MPVLPKSNGVSIQYLSFLIRILSLLVLLGCVGFNVKAQQILPQTPVPNFVLQNEFGQDMALDSFKGKVLLVNFWASWCWPCRVQNRKLIKQYQRRKPAGFEVLSISVDANRDQWLAALRRDKMPWPQLMDDLDPTKMVSRKWKVTALPASYLLNPSGKLIATDGAALFLKDPMGFHKLVQSLMRVPQL